MNRLRALAVGWVAWLLCGCVNVRVSAATEEEARKTMRSAQRAMDDAEYALRELGDFLEVGAGVLVLFVVVYAVTRIVAVSQMQSISRDVRRIGTALEIRTAEEEDSTER